MSSFGDFFRQLSALAWKNRILKLRYWGTLLLEIVVPTTIIIAIGLLSTVIPPITYDQTFPSSANQISTFFSPSQNLGNIYYGTGLCNSFGNVLWTCANKIPCANQNTNKILMALKNCQLKYIGVAPTSSSNVNASKAAKEFVNFANSQYSNVTFLNNTQIFVLFQSESAFKSYVTSPSYSLDPSVSVYGAGIVFQSGYPHWQYKLRTNMTYDAVSMTFTHFTSRFVLAHYHYLFPVLLVVFKEVISTINLLSSC